MCRRQLFARQDRTQHLDGFPDGPKRRRCDRTE
jgi:hypothetical protein